MAGVDWKADRYHTRYGARWRREVPPEPIARGEPHPYLGGEEAETPCRFPVVGGGVCGGELDTAAHDPHLFRRFC